MSVATQLGLNHPDNEVLALARDRWSQWQDEQPALRVVEVLDDLPAWLVNQPDRDRADEVLLALAELSSPEGADDVAATGALTWLLLPGASTIASTLDPIAPQVDELLAAALWVEARTFPWQRGRRVAANILMNARKSVMRDLGLGSASGATWDRSTVVDSHEIQDLCDQLPGDAGPSPEVELRSLLDWACGQGVITDEDRALLVDVAEAADRHSTGGSRGSGGLLGNRVSAEIAGGRGVSALTIRRRTHRCVAALREARGVDRVSA